MDRRCPIQSATAVPPTKLNLSENFLRSGKSSTCSLVKISLCMFCKIKFEEIFHHWIIIAPFLLSLLAENFGYPFHSENLDKLLNVFPIPVIQSMLHNRLFGETFKIPHVPNKIGPFFDKIAKRGLLHMTILAKLNRQINLPHKSTRLRSFIFS